MAKKSKSVAAKKASAKRAGGDTRKKAVLKPMKSFRPAHGELLTLLDLMRYGVSRFVEAGVVFAHGTTDPVAEAAFIVCEVLHLHPDQFEMFANARVTSHEAAKILALFDKRIATRKPAAYLVNKIYMRGLPFYVDERVIVPRSFIGELLDSHFGGVIEEEGGSLIDDPGNVTRVLDLCTGSGCLAILACQSFPNATVDAVDISGDALAVAARNVADYGLEDRVSLYQGDLFDALDDERYDLIITNPPYVDAEGMEGLPHECLHEPSIAFDGGDDGLDIVRRILDAAKDHLTPDGGLLCEIGRGRDVLGDAYPNLPLLWLDTEDSDGEVFWIPAEAL
ncbi:50S ribosomal protein L3 N(5)-glutamine methyltransferase [Bradyrhizobium sp. G127]|uniref:50S ribosomal protein L3 N(5)-glutamine methyltransferase n=1 Tax=Bradyrhizobium sp. G127 TaxID=2904800 RepID=UPI001F277365|nr:50S ribosomal protein L3 N(5)-glutamine methyltransferase [Bradyrhizobium sp. G127]MCF2522223.1 50S ribosomal protein L3 N(5)-glutamine methyltransferase [Bradyrhizobium sp. G127]